MWTRGELKTQAKAVLSRSLGWAILICLVGGILGGSVGGSGSGGISSGYSSYSSGVNSGSSFTNDFSSGDFSSGYYSDVPSEAAPIAAAVAAAMGGVMLVAIAFGIALSLFVSSPVSVGMSRWFIRNRERPKAPEFAMLFSGFGGGTYLQVVGAMAWRTLIVFLWSLLLIVPGIIKGYAYRMVPFILADNPTIGHKRAMELSDQMTMGHKGSIWVLDLSFIGWSLLAVLTCGLGLIVLNPYMAATEAELYAVLRHNALMSGMCSFEELNFAPAPPPPFDGGSFAPPPPFDGGNFPAPPQA